MPRWRRRCGGWRRGLRRWPPGRRRAPHTRPPCRNAARRRPAGGSGAGGGRISLFRRWVPQPGNPNGRHALPLDRRFRPRHLLGRPFSARCACWPRLSPAGGCRRKRPRSWRWRGCACRCCARVRAAATAPDRSRHAPPPGRPRSCCTSRIPSAPPTTARPTAGCLGSRSRALPSPRAVTPDLSAAICTYRRYHLLDAAIASLQAQQGVSGGDPGGGQLPRQPRCGRGTGALRGAGALDRGAGGGPMRARNAALAAATAPVLAFLDDDARAAPGWAAGFLAGFARLGTAKWPVWAGGCGCPSPPRRRRGSTAGWRPISALDWGRRRRPLAAGEWVAGASVAYRTAALREVGGFDTALGRSGAALSLAIQ